MSVGSALKRAPKPFFFCVFVLGTVIYHLYPRGGGILPLVWTLFLAWAGWKSAGMVSFVKMGPI